MSLVARAHRCRDGGQIDRDRAEWCHQHSGEAGGSEQRCVTGTISVHAQNGEARDVLPCHGDDKERYREAHDRGEREARRYPDELRL